MGFGRCADSRIEKDKLQVAMERIWQLHGFVLLFVRNFPLCCLHRKSKFNMRSYDECDFDREIMCAYKLILKVGGVLFHTHTTVSMQKARIHDPLNFTLFSWPKISPRYYKGNC